MSRKQGRQTGKGKEREAALVAVDSDEIAPDQQQIRVYTPENVEYQGYNDLLRGFFEKFIRWKEIFSSYKKEDYTRYLRVAQTPQGLRLDTTKWRAHLPSQAEQDTMMYIDMTELEGELDMHFYPGPKGEQVFADPDGEPLTDAAVGMHRYAQEYGGGNDVVIWAGYPNEKVGPSFDKANKRYLPPHIQFKFEADGSLQISPVTLYGI